MDKAVRALQKNGFDVRVFDTKEEAVSALMEDIKVDEPVGLGGSITLQDMKIYDHLSERGNTVYWHWKAEDKGAALRDAASSKVYITSTNAVTEDGKLVNKDGTGNRVSSMFYGHERVYIVAGKNKIVRNYGDAIYRIEHTAAPMNAKRLNLTTPCVYTGVCSDCDSPQRICNVETVINKKPGGVGKIVIYLVNEDLGY
ncbi:lactate utilization protein [Gudongella oleilytica]|uniref:lactate utilization protein n=1 Tax=Gudongella oleilytica TaxID=1582259 RepID=UPI000FF8ADF3|nr:lactate utilization protein [Gudongella oleilytica]